MQLPTRLTWAEPRPGQHPGPSADGHTPIRAATCTDPALAQDLLQLQPAIDKANTERYNFLASGQHCPRVYAT